MADSVEITQPPTRLQQNTDLIFRKLCQALACLSALLVVFIIVKIVTAAMPAMKEYGLQFVTGATWDPNKNQYAVLPEIWGTLYTSLLALMLGTFFGLAAAIFLSEGYLAEAVFGLLKIVSPGCVSVLGEAARSGRASIEEPDRAARGDSERGLRTVGHLRRHPDVASGCNWLHAEARVGCRCFRTDLSGPECCRRRSCWRS